MKSPTFLIWVNYGQLDRLQKRWMVSWSCCGSMPLLDDEHFTGPRFCWVLDILFLFYPCVFRWSNPYVCWKNQKNTMCFNLFVFLHYVSPSSERLCDKKYSIYYIYRFLWVSSKVPLSSQATDHVGTNIRSLGVDATSQPRLRGNHMKSWPVDAGGPVIKHGSGKVER